VVCIQHGCGVAFQLCQFEPWPGHFLMHRCDPTKKKIEEEEEEGAHPRIPGLGPPYAEGQPKKKKGKKKQEGAYFQGNQNTWCDQRNTDPDSGICIRPSC